MPWLLAFWNCSRYKPWNRLLKVWPSACLGHEKRREGSLCPFPPSHSPTSSCEWIIFLRRGQGTTGIIRYTRHLWCVTPCYLQLVTTVRTPVREVFDKKLRHQLSVSLIKDTMCMYPDRRCLNFWRNARSLWTAHRGFLIGVNKAWRTVALLENIDRHFPANAMSLPPSCGRGHIWVSVGPITKIWELQLRFRYQGLCRQLT